jgi:hypothetical protein
MKKLLGISVLCGMCFEANSQTPPEATTSKKIQVKSYEGTMRDNLPVPSNASKKTEIFYPRPGEVSFSTQVWCGDGDVAHYYSAHPNEVYNKGASIQRLAMGYWVTSGSEKVPDPSSWFLMGYSDIASTKGFLNKIKRANSSAENQASVILTDELNKLKNQFTVLSSIRDEKKFNVYAGVMLCNSYQDNSGINTSKDSPTAATIADRLVDYYKNKSIKDSKEILNGKIAKASFSGSEGLLNIQFVGGNSSNIYDEALKKLKDLDCKDVCIDSTNPSSGSSKTISDYRDYLNKDKLVDRLITLSSTCKNQLKKGSVQYWWESVSMSLDCQEVGAIDFSNLIQNLKADTKSSSDPALSIDEFNKIKIDLEAALSRSALVKQVQDSIDGLGLSKNKGRCFPVGRPYIETIIASLPYSFTQKITDQGTILVSIQGSKSEMTMPEPNYALGAAAQYYKNERAVFMSDGDPMIIDITKTLPVISFGSGVTFPMHVRDVGCSNGPGYCILKHKDRFFERLN